ncbi:hypothetical protein COT40_02335 [Candidatus Peregrinibacteria bacterium CG08_land_8_20_14_0_20_41_10]|nr:MAG: hypothetical protein AUJ78_00925 [Candidatus Peregrinibacteria bacterium CG1_02_41_10]PIS32011.1 MAG: hypothetical protein COT40_02335 [Candidatus Peregrinibacteria bacterium CG08_land_8_20_14_0_20_41_10]
MRILITRFPYASEFGGLETHTLALFERLKRLGFQFKLISTCPILLQEFQKRHWNCRKIWWPKPPVSKLAVLSWLLFLPYQLVVGSWWLLAGKMKKYDTIYMLSFGEKLSLTLLARLLGYRVFWIEHERVRRWWTKNPYLFWYCFCSRFAMVVCVSGLLKKDLEKMRIKNLKVIYNGVDTEFFSPRYKEKLSSLHRRGVECFTPPRCIVGTLARLKPEKGIDLFLHAAAKIAREIPQAVFVVAGDGPERNNLIQLTKKLELESRVEFLGELNQAQVRQFYNSIDVLVLPSTEQETFGLIAAEASAMRVPVVLTDQFGLTDLIKSQELLVVPAGNVEVLSTAILKIHHDDSFRVKLIRSGFELVKHKISLEKMTKEYAKLFQN